MADRQKNLGRARVLDFSSLEEDEAESSWGAPLTDQTRLAPLDDDPTGELMKPRTEEAEPLLTAFSSRAFLIADLLRDKFSRRFFGRSPYRVLRVDEPEGPSTAGGRLARQPISLVAREGSAPSIICGWVDTSKGEAQLRSYASVARRYESHHGVELDLSPDHYERFLEDLVDALISGGIKVRVLVLDEQLAAPEQAQASAPRGLAARARGRERGGRLLVLGIVLGLLAGRWVPWERLDAALTQVWSTVSAQVAGRL
ncbi:hypothetical protein [Archangium sp.]|jgi:hypothetical protein|uniref:hypothetical protein n=1 Tax=Archangium sp. TaxID=1872627 RepID=UPI002ED91ABF